MSITLSKGGTISLTKAAGPVPLDLIEVGLGWAGKGDLDASALICDVNGRALSDRDFVFYNNPASPTQAVRHMGDALEGGDDDGDDETIKVTLSQLPPTAARVVFVVSIYEAASTGTHFGTIDSAYVRVVNAADGSELARYDLTGQAAGDDALIFAELYRDASGWGFRAIGESHCTGLAGTLSMYGLNAG
jgi:tellurium resistance protein TerD